jgi:hypothetical protein
MIVREHHVLIFFLFRRSFGTVHLAVNNLAQTEWAIKILDKKKVPCRDFVWVLLATLRLFNRA